MSKLCLIDPNGLEMAAMKYNENHPDSPLTCNDFKLIDRFLSEYPTVDVAPVVHGHWIEDEMADGHPVWICSICGEEDCYAYTWGEVKRQDDLYCPKCGADMRGDNS